MVNNDLSLKREIGSFIHSRKSNAAKRDSSDQIPKGSENHLPTSLSGSQETKQMSDKGNENLSVIPLGPTCDEDSIIPVRRGKSVTQNESKPPKQIETRTNSIDPRHKSMKIVRTSIRGNLGNFNIGEGGVNPKDNLSTVVCSPIESSQKQGLSRTTGLEKKVINRSCPKKQDDNLSTVVCSPEQVEASVKPSKANNLNLTISTSTDIGNDTKTISKEGSIVNVISAIHVPKCIEQGIVKMNPFNFDREKGKKKESQGSDEVVTNTTEVGSDMACSPKHREDGIIPISSPRQCDDQNHDTGDEENPIICCSNMSKEVLKKGVKKHTGAFPFGVSRTVFPVIFSIVALICSIISKESTNFVTLEKPLYIDSEHLPVTEVGLFFMKVCETDKLENIDIALGLNTVRKVEYDEKSIAAVNDYIHSEATDHIEIGKIITLETKKTKCRKYKLGSTLVRDRLWNTARCFVGLTAGIGVLFAIATFTTIFWNSINLIVVSAGIFVTYLCQSFAFLFYDTNICKRHICHRSTGTTVAIVASFFWFFAGIGVMWLYIYDRNEKQKQMILSLRAKSKSKKDLENKERELVMIQWSILDFFRKRSTSNSDTDSHSSAGVSRVSL